MFGRYTRRGMIAGAAGIATAQAQGAKTIRAARAIHHEEDFPAAPGRVYEALLDAKQFQDFSKGLAAEIHREAGGAFSVFGGHIVGRTLELVPSRRIVQAWRVVTWDEGIHSIARFEFQSRGSGTRVIFDHTGFPSELAEHLESGWQENYWRPLRKYVG